MRPRIINSEGVVIDANKVAYVAAIEKGEDNFFCFTVGGECGYGLLTFQSTNQDKLEEVRRRLISFIWPNADVFDAGNADDFSDSATT
jgi:hypothetical protein